MNLFRVSVLCVMSAAIAACTADEEGSLVEPIPAAGLRYFNAVADTGAMDFRVIDIVGDAPYQTQATFRTGGWPQGISTTLPPWYNAVQAGDRRIRVFLYHTHPDTASTVMFDTTFTFVANTNYTFILYGYARSGTAGHCCKAMITTDSVPTPASGQVVFRAIHLGPGTTVGSVDAHVVATTATAGTTPPTFSSLAYESVSSYVAATAGTLKVAVTAAGTTTPLVFSGNATTGVAGTSTANPIAGGNVGGSGLTALILPPSVTGSQATSFTTPGVVFLIDRKPDRTAP